MKNQAGFIPKNLMQPHYYVKIFDLYCAVYIANNDVEYQIQIVGNPVIDRIDGFEILVQQENGRKHLVRKSFKTLKSAVNHLRDYLTNNDLL